MKSDRFYETMDPARVALLLGLNVGLGIAVHEGFFLCGSGYHGRRARRGHYEHDLRSRGSQPA